VPEIGPNEDEEGEEEAKYWRIEVIKCFRDLLKEVISEQFYGQ
jgi:hypothetical protein